MEARDLRKMSVDEYLALDRESEERWEYVNGEAFAMAGASRRHNAIVANIFLVLGTALKGKPCFPLAADQQVETSATRAFHYPDLVVLCGKPRVSGKHEQAITNPTVIIEIASASTSDYDRGAKFDHYATIPELEEFVAVMTESRRVEHRKRTGDGQWLLTILVGTGALRLSSLGIEIPLDDIYADLERVEP